MQDPEFKQSNKRRLNSLLECETDAALEEFTTVSNQNFWKENGQLSHQNETEGNVSSFGVWFLVFENKL